MNPRQERFCPEFVSSAQTSGRRGLISKDQMILWKQGKVDSIVCYRISPGSKDLEQMYSEYFCIHQAGY